MAGLYAAKAEKESLDACRVRRAEFKNQVELLQCFMAAIKATAAAEKLRDTDLLDSYSSAILAAAADADAGKITPQQMVMTISSVGSAFDSAVFLEYGAYAFGLTKAPPGDTPPFSYAACPRQRRRQSRQRRFVMRGRKGTISPALSNSTLASMAQS